MTEDYDFDYCDSCRGYGDDYKYDENGNLVPACDECPYNPYKYGDDEQ